VVYFELSPDADLEIPKLRWVLTNFRLVGFNSINYDLPVVRLALTGAGTVRLHRASGEIINGMQRREFEQTYTPAVLTVDHIDLIEVAPLQGSLKLYAGRLHAPIMKDLPIDPQKALTQAEADTIREYCLNDLDNTALLLAELKGQIELRERLSAEYGQDLRSRSDAQIAEHVISAEVCKLNGRFPKRPKDKEGTSYKYKVPAFVRYASLSLAGLLDTIRAADFAVGEDGSIQLPKELAELTIRINEGVYRLGIGGLHSSEKAAKHIADEDTLLIDRDVASYYPSIILNQGLFPKHMGKAFLEVYRAIVNRRLAAKEAGNKLEAESLKITINGSFGKFGNKYSSLYSPDLLIQTTVSGQLCLLMLIDMIEAARIQAVSEGRLIRCRVISANTDGLVIACPAQAYSVLEEIIQEWESLTSFKTEETRYRALYCRDVNNYVGIKEDGSTKLKGAYANPWSVTGANVFRLHKNPASTVCVEAVIELLRSETPIEQSIKAERDIRKFVTVRNVKGGAVQGGSYVGKTVRWYYSTEGGVMNYIASGNKVPLSDGARALMTLPTELPPDLDYNRYFKGARDILTDFEYYQQSLF
jgi:DNA polymerase elongation subunit (family B)